MRDRSSLPASSAELTEQSQNVYENKGPAQESTPDPSSTKEGNHRMHDQSLPGSPESGSADRRLCGLRLFRDRRDGPRPQTRRSALPKSQPLSPLTPQLSYERSGNVVENKERLC